MAKTQKKAATQQAKKMGRMSNGERRWMETTPKTLDAATSAGGEAGDKGETRGALSRRLR
jgi:hypothetical protein